MSGWLRRALWFALGWVAVALGTVGIVVPGLPSTVFFILAASCFSRSSPRFEQWVLTRPGVGPLVRDYRAGLGLRVRVKATAITSVVIVCSLSIVMVNTWWQRVVIGAAALVGMSWILWRIPTRRDG